MGVREFIGRWRARHGIARGVAVFGPGSREDLEQLTGLLADWPLLREHADAAGVDLDSSRQSLVDLDRLIDDWRHDAETASWLGNEAGTYLGGVLVTGVPDARWRIWPNGHPVVRLPSGRELDVVELAHRRVSHDEPKLAAVYDDALR
jgi:hypothetical protein